MLLHEELAPDRSRVKFISYTGRWPSLCSGELRLEIGGGLHIFDSRTPEDRNTAYTHPRFWEPEPGSHISEHCQWAVDVSLLPPALREYAREIDAAINAEGAMERPHCGGCS